MLEEETGELKEMIASIRFGIIKITDKRIFNNNRFLIETTGIDEEGYIWCFTKDPVPSSYHSGKTFPVSLKYVNKDKRIYLSVSGECIINEIKTETISVNKNVQKICFLKVRIIDAQFFKKRSLSGYTSIFHSVWKIPWRKLAFKKKIRA